MPEASVLEPIKREFEQFIQERITPDERVILGCTELAVLVDDDMRTRITFEDPLENVLEYLKKTIN